MMSHVKIYLTCLRTSFSQAAAYRADFLMSNLITLLSNILFPLATILIYTNGAEFTGWSMWEVLLIQSVFSMSSGVATMVCSSILWVTMDHVRQGSFETVLLKPISPLFFILSAHFDTSGIGLFAGGLTLTIISSVHVGVVAFGNVVQFLILFLAGLIVLCGLDLVMAAISFRWVGNSRIPEIFDSMKEFGKYPLVIFPKGVRIVASFVIPVAMVGFFPASALLGKIGAWTFLSVIPCVLFLIFGVWIYNRMIKLYEGVGG
ncbi:MAG: ABC-2 family transporter protein [Lachnospiraceae bacterium]|nr:ABC-2 family transporter protein [Lachnospiraceae bacterium]